MSLFKEVSGDEILNYLRRQILKNWKKWEVPPAWTEGIKKSLKELGRQRKYKICASLSGSDYPEWLYDLCWSKGHIGVPTKYKGLCLIVEIEWKGDYDILYDFQKLTAGVADLRLIVICYGKCNRGMDWVRKVIIKCKACCPQGMLYKYIIIAIPEDINDEIVKEEWCI